MKPSINVADRQRVPCPCCASGESEFWAEENGFDVVRCKSCQLLYVNPRESTIEIDSAVRSGVHKLERRALDVRAKRVPNKIGLYRKVILNMFPDLFNNQTKIIWVDVGSGYGEVLESVQSLAGVGSTVIGVEPMQHKADSAKSRGLEVVNAYLEPSQYQADVISLIDIFSHIPDFHAFLGVVATNLKNGGAIFLETGNLGDLESRDEFPGQLGLPDHLVFLGEKNIYSYLDAAGFEIISIRRMRVDGIVNFVKNVIKKVIGQPVRIRIPYTSSYCSMQVRARLR
jgi:SAM-dependent methyltransferase